MSARYRDDNSRELTGLIIILIGFGLLLNAIGILPFATVFSRFWMPMMFIAFGLIHFIKSRGTDNWLGGVFWIGLGVLFFIGKLNSVTFNVWRLLGPAIVIWIGLSILMKGSAFRPSRRDFPPGVRRTDSDNVDADADSINATAFLGEFNQKSTSPKFDGGSLTAIMGGGKVDFREADFEGDEVVLDVFTLMGGIEVLIPDRWIVQNRMTAILAGIEDKTRPARDAVKRFTVRGTAVLGSVEIKN